MATKFENEARAMLEQCMTQFQYYADIHNSKDTHEARLKADVNLRFVARIKGLLDGTA